MKLDNNNNSNIIYRISKSNLKGNKLYSFFTALTIFLSVSLIAVLLLFVLALRTETNRTLDNMQDVMFMNVSKEQIAQLTVDAKTDLVLDYKEQGETYKHNGVKYSFYYIESSDEGILTYTPTEGNIPQQENEIVVNKKFMQEFGNDNMIGETITLTINDIDASYEETFRISGYIENEYDYATYPIYVSRSFAENNALMKDIPYTALTRITDAREMEISEFNTAIYELAANYRISKDDVNINDKLMLLLSKGNSDLATIFTISILVMLASSIVIYSIFYVSLSTRIQQIGQLQTIGMTQKQIRKMVRMEGFFLSILAIPMGLIFAGALTYFLRPNGWSFFNFGISSLLIAIMSIAAVQTAIKKPASLAAKASPIEASRNFSETAENGKIKEAPHKKLTPFTMAKLSRGNDRKKFFLSTMSLAFGGILFMASASYISSWDEDAYSREEDFRDCEYIIDFRYNAHANYKTYGVTDFQLDSSFDLDLEERVRQITNVEHVKRIDSMSAVMEYQGRSLLHHFYPYTENSTDYRNAITKGSSDYETLAGQDAILVLNTESLKKGFEKLDLTVGDTITLSWFDGVEHTREFTVAGTAPNEVKDNHRVTFMLPQSKMEELWNGINMTSSLQISIHDYDLNNEIVERQIEDILNDYPQLRLRTLREKKLEDSNYIKKEFTSIYGIAIFVVMFSLLNLVNTIITNIVTRRRELSMLESIGMEEQQINKMLRYESIFLVLPNIFLTMTFGTLAGFSLITLTKKIADVEHFTFTFPTVPAIMYAIFMLLVPILISWILLKMQNKVSLVERIKSMD